MTLSGCHSLLLSTFHCTLAFYQSTNFFHLSIKVFCNISSWQQQHWEEKCPQLHFTALIQTLVFNSARTIKVNQHLPANQDPGCQQYERFYTPVSRLPCIMSYLITPCIPARKAWRVHMTLAQALAAVGGRFSFDRGQKSGYHQACYKLCKQSGHWIH